ncbi:rCG38003, partial [Rattus norvegicus]
MTKVSRNWRCSTVRNCSSLLLLEDLQAHSNFIYYPLQLGLGTDEDMVTEVEPSTAVLTGILLLE